MGEDSNVLALLEDWIRSLKIFKRSKKPLRVKVEAFLNWLISSSCRKTAKFLSLTRIKVSKSSVNEWCIKIRNALEKVEWNRAKVHKLVAIDETCLKINGEKHWVYAALDVENKELIEIVAFPNRDMLNTLIFLKKVLKLCKGKKPKFLRDKAPWLKEALDYLKLEQEHQTFGLRNLIERLFGYLKHRTKLFFNNININLRKALNLLDQGLKLRRGLSLLKSFLRAFKFYFDFLR